MRREDVGDQMWLSFNKRICEMQLAITTSHFALLQTHSSKQKEYPTLVR